mmetsp:Transcript_9799/g.9461  ORF Transcript_9799/g.9461 Transcript_9799/m.9461 type:complete len:239 (-) Transcript_9799:29-745(-)
MDTSIKQNANPTVYSKTETKSQFSDETLIGTSYIQSFGRTLLEEQNTCLAWSSDNADNKLSIFEQAGLGKKTKDTLFPSSSDHFTTTTTTLRDKIRSEEVFEMIRNIQDPEHLDLTLEQLNVLNLKHVYVIDNHLDLTNAHNNKNDKSQSPEQLLSYVHVYITPTIPHCSMATLIGLSVRVKLLRSLPRRFKVSIQIFPGTHASEGAINKQLNDKERVCAALENTHLLSVVNSCIKIK